MENLMNKAAWRHSLENARRLLVTGLIVVLLVYSNDKYISENLSITEEPIDGFTHFEIKNSPLSAGDIMIARAFRVKNRDDCHVTVTRQAIRDDNALIDLPGFDGVGGAAGTAFVDVYVQLPSYMPPGRYEVSADASYQCPDRTKPFEYVIPTAILLIQE